MLNSGGRIEKQGSAQSLCLASAVEVRPSADSSKALTDSEDNSPSTKRVETLTVDDIADIARRTGDTAVYKYYLKAIGWRHTLVAVLIIIVHTFSSAFPREYCRFHYDVAWLC